MAPVDRPLLAIAHNAPNISQILEIFGKFSIIREFKDGLGRKIVFCSYSRKADALSCVKSLGSLRCERFLIEAHTSFISVREVHPFDNLKPKRNLNKQRIERVKALLNETNFVEISPEIGDFKGGSDITVFVECVLPMPCYKDLAVSDSFTESATRRKIGGDNLRLWDGFASHVQSTDLRKFQELIGGAGFTENKQTFYDERSVSMAFRSNISRILKYFLDDDEEFGGYNRVEDWRKLIGDADYVFVKNREPLIMIEFKAAKFGSPDVIKDYLSEMSDVRNVLEQCYGYMVRDKLELGILSTFDSTWFLRIKDDIVYISEPIPWHSTSPTVTRSVVHMISLARDLYEEKMKTQKDRDEVKLTNSPFEQKNYDPRSSSSPKRQTPPKSDPNNEAKGGDDNEKKRQTFCIEDFEFGKVVGRGRSGRVFSAKWENEIVAVKLYNLHKKPHLEEELHNELTTYDVLGALQGECIPKLFAHGYCGKSYYAVVFQKIGRGKAIVPSKLTEGEVAEIENKFSAIHDCGVLHGDVRAANIVKGESGFYIIDFGFSNPNCKIQKDLFKEMDDLHLLLTGK